jgi:DNA-binding NtrC family response regulator
LSKSRILIVDDDEDLCDELAEALDEAGYHTEYASEAVKAQKLVSENRYDIVLLDYKMPDPGGVGVLRTLKAQTAKTKVLIISGRPFVENLLEEAGLIDFVGAVVPKPIAFEVLLDAIRKVVTPEP